MQAWGAIITAVGAPHLHSQHSRINIRGSFLGCFEGSSTGSTDGLSAGIVRTRKDNRSLAQTWHSRCLQGSSELVDCIVICWDPGVWRWRCWACCIDRGVADWWKAIAYGNYRHWRAENNWHEEREMRLPSAGRGMRKLAPDFVSVTYRQITSVCFITRTMKMPLPPTSVDQKVCKALWRAAGARFLKSWDNSWFLKVGKIILNKTCWHKFYDHFPCWSVHVLAHCELFCINCYSLL